MQTIRDSEWSKLAGTTLIWRSIQSNQCKHGRLRNPKYTHTLTEIGNTNQMRCGSNSD